MDIEIVSIESEAEETVVKIEKVDSENETSGEAPANNQVKPKPKILMKIRDVIENSKVVRRLKSTKFNFKFGQVKVKTPKKRKADDNDQSSKRLRIQEVENPILRRSKPKPKVPRKPPRTLASNATSSTRNLFPEGYRPGPSTIRNPIANERDGRILSVIVRNPNFINDPARTELEYPIYNPIFNFDI